MHGLTSCKIVAVWIFTLSNHLYVIWGLSTQKCSHNQLRTQLRGHINCMMATHLLSDSDYGYDDLETLQLQCMLIDRMTECFVLNLGTCLDAQLTGDLSMVPNIYLKQQLHADADATGLYCDDTNYDYATQDDGPDFMNTIIRFISEFSLDKQCMTSELIQAIQDQTVPCFTEKLTTIIASSEGTSSQKLDLCKSISDTLESCLIANDCISQREMDLIKDLAATAYKFVMFGWSNLLDGVELFPGMADIDGKVVDRLEGMFSGIGDMVDLRMVIEDYQVAILLCMIMHISLGIPQTSKNNFFDHLYLPFSELFLPSKP